MFFMGVVSMTKASCGIACPSMRARRYGWQSAPRGRHSTSRGGYDVVGVEALRYQGRLVAVPRVGDLPRLRVPRVPRAEGPALESLRRESGNLLRPILQARS
ncbi:hypothetical protein J3459_006690 [Metarhizium acridum]|nr:hypothetical protein J3459_006690 [Metarhizium acridum]